MRRELMSYIPNKYKAYIADFHIEYEDGYSYWLSLKCNGKYHFEGYVSEYTIHESTLTEILRVFRQCIRVKNLKVVRG